MKKLAMACLFSSFGFACASPATSTAPMQPAPSHPAPLAATCACGGDKLAPNHETGCPCAGHQDEASAHTCGCGTGPEAHGE